MRETVTAGASAGMLLLSAANNLIGARAFSYSFSPRSDIELSNWKPTLHFFLRASLHYTGSSRFLKKM